MEREVDQIRNALGRRFAQLQAEKNHNHFFFGLADYLNYADNKPILRKAIKQLLNTSEKELGELLGPSFLLRRSIIETGRRAQTFQKSILLGLFGREIKPPPLEGFVPINRTVLAHVDTNPQLAEEMKTTPWGAAMCLAEVPTLIDKLFADKKGDRGYPSINKWRNCLIRYHNYLLDYLEDFSKRGEYLEARNLRFWLKGQVEVVGSGRKGYLAPKTKSYKLLRALMERYYDNPKAWLKPEEAWEVVYEDKKRTGKWKRTLQTGPYRNLQEALGKITKAKLIEIKGNAIRVK